MNTNLLRPLVALTALLSLNQLHAGTPARLETPLAEVAARIHANGDTVARGTSRVMVAARLGAPTSVLPDGSWLYSGYTARSASRRELVAGTLVVRFAESKVISLSIADQATVVALRSAPAAPVKEKTFVAGR